MKKLWCSLVFFVFAVCAYSQVAADVFNPFYDDVQQWEDAGLITNAPPLRPFPLQVVKKILQEVIQKGDPLQQKTALDYYQRFFNRFIHGGAEVSLALRVPEKDRKYDLAPLAEVNYAFTDLFSVSGFFSVRLTNKVPRIEALPLFTHSRRDLAEDNAKSGKTFILPSFNTSMAIGNDGYYFTAGINRNSFGPFFDDSVFLSPHAQHAGSFNFVVNQEKWAYTHSLLTLTAVADDYGINAQTTRKPGKFLSIHSLSVRPIPELSFGLVESMTYGGRFEPIYLLPFSVFFVSQGLYNFPDNSMIGGFFSVKPIPGLRFDGELYADDLGFNEIIKVKRARWRIAGKFGISYTMPKTHWFRFVRLNYTFVTPYAYTHYDSEYPSNVNYQNYTHYGTSLGSSLPPNSDKIHLALQFRLREGLALDIFNTFIRHANITESLTDQYMLKDYLSKYYPTDGSILNHASAIGGNGRGLSWANRHAFLYDTPFLQQKTIQYVNQLGFGLKVNLPIVASGGRISFLFGYMFEANINAGVNKNIYSPVSAAWAKKSYGSLSAAEKQLLKQAAEAQLAKWQKNAKVNKFTHYLKAVVTVAY